MEQPVLERVYWHVTNKADTSKENQHIQACTAEEIEAPAIYKGIKMAKNQEETQVIVESDKKALVNLLLSQDKELTWRVSIVIRDCRFLLNTCLNVMVRHPAQLCLFCFVMVRVCCLSVLGTGQNGSPKTTSPIPVGVVLDLNSTVGEMARVCIDMALSEFYAVHTNYRTKVVLHTRNSKGDAVNAASAAFDLLKSKEVQAIIGPQKSAEAKFVIDLGDKARVPIISFSATSPSLSPIQNPFFVRTTLNDSSQVNAIKAIVQNYGWKEVVPIYEDTDYGSGVIPYLIDAFQDIDVRVPYRSVIPPSAKDGQIVEELNQLKTMQTRVFVVHMTASLGSRFFLQVEENKMMTEGFVWIITDGLSSLIDPMNSTSIDSMDGVLGLKPFIPESKLEEFKTRWEKRFYLDKPNRKIGELSLFGLWAYDTIWALAMAVERVGAMNTSFLKRDASENPTSIATIGYSQMGPNLLKAILSTKFKGLSGDFHLVKGQLETSAFQIFNLIGKVERVIGYWSPKYGLSQDLPGKSKSNSGNNLIRNPIWPGDSFVTPKGWVIPIEGKKLRIGVPVKDGFKEFLKITTDPQINETSFSGFSIDVFLAALSKLPFAVPYHFIPYMKPDGQSIGSYDELIYQVHLKKFDAVVGDITIVANRSRFVDFTLPYSESGVSMVVPIRNDKSGNAWIFLKPLTWELWLTTGAAFVFTGIVVWILEHRVNTDFRGPPTQQIGMTFWFSFSTLVFAHRERVVNNLSRFVLIIWVFVVLILAQSYTASLTSMLTVQQLQPMLTDILELKDKGYYVGYQKGFICEGAADKKVFPTGSPLVPYFSKAILNLKEGDEMDKIEGTWFQKKTQCQDQSTEVSSSSTSLSLRSFWGLFLITGLASVSSLLIFLIQFLYEQRQAANSSTASPKPIWEKILSMAQRFDQKDLSSHTFRRAESRIHPINEAEGTEMSSNTNDSQITSRVHNQTVPLEEVEEPVHEQRISSPQSGNPSTSI
ncbi:PREDICTED: glutamate receptor 2.8-like [Nelumbo nucifera]|uniref:Glutamate receptor n=1 Tax=Nelumbo nucifera TaxID=4432 RepID=A0A1U8Q0A6_NELNU|nr:PREDICTED: glutamate receptor 2.8-like [Nelumbo nucifera]